MIKKNMNMKRLAELLNTSSSNLSNKMSRDNFSEKELHDIAEALDCDFEVGFIIRATGEKI